MSHSKQLKEFITCISLKSLTLLINYLLIYYRSDHSIKNILTSLYKIKATLQKSSLPKTLTTTFKSLTSLFKSLTDLFKS